VRLEHRLKALGSVPVTHGTLLSVIGNYLSPNDKIARMTDEGLLLRIRRGMYAVAPEITGTPVS